MEFEIAFVAGACSGCPDESEDPRLPRSVLVGRDVECCACIDLSFPSCDHKAPAGTSRAALDGAEPRAIEAPPAITPAPLPARTAPAIPRPQPSLALIRSVVLLV